jgi:hypothetical protein
MYSKSFSVSVILTAIMLAAAAQGTASGMDYYVSVSGNDSAPGTSAKPFATLEAARDAIRKAKASGKMPAEGVTVWLEGGTYLRSQAFSLGQEDSGTATARIVYRAMKGQEVRIVGGQYVSPSAFKKVSDAAVLERMDPAARGNVLELDLAALGVKHAGPYPDVFKDNGGIIEVFYDNQRMVLSRYPKEGYMIVKKVLRNGGGQQKPGLWKEYYRDPVYAKTIEGPNAPGIFEYRDPRHKEWLKAIDRGLWLQGYWRTAWQTEAIRVKKIDTAAETVEFAAPIEGGIGSKYSRPEGSGKEQYWAFNLLEELSKPGEWCIDFKLKKLYFRPPGPLGDKSVLISDIDDPLVMAKDASFITIRGLTLEGTLGNGIEIRGGRENLIAGCTIRNTAKNAVVVDGGTAHTVQSCDMYHLGAGGVWLSGGDEKSNPRVPAGHRVVNNHIHHFAEIERVYAAAVNVGFTGGGGGGHHPAVGMYVANNLIHDTPHVGILFGSWDSVFEYNEIFRYCLVSNDMGGLYCYDKFERSGNRTIRYNLMHSSPLGDGVYFDCDHRDDHVYGNVVVGGSTGFVFKHGTAGGAAMVTDCRNNIAVNCLSRGFRFVLIEGSRAENNIAVGCKDNIEFITGKDGNGITGTGDKYAGKNFTGEKDPGFVNLAGLDLRLRKDSVVLKELPGFEQIPFEKTGLYVDEYRTKLPSDTETGRLGAVPAGVSKPEEIQDRK